MTHSMIDSKLFEKSCACVSYFLILIAKKVIKYLKNYNLVFFTNKIDVILEDIYVRIAKKAVSSHYFTWINRLKLLKVVTWQFYTQKV